MQRLSGADLKALLDDWADRVNVPGFIPDDPVSIPHAYSKRQDIEIAGLFAATLSWGNRKTILSKSRELMKLMDDSPHEFLVGAAKPEYARFGTFVHRTFNPVDVLGFAEFLRRYYRSHISLEDAFQPDDGDPTVESGLVRFHKLITTNSRFAERTRKHVSFPRSGSACKRLNMFLRWMVRSDGRGVDFGLWRSIRPSQLVCPLDVHVGRVSRELGLVKRKPLDWRTALELTDTLRRFDAEDPVRYDFALFGMGVEDRTFGRWINSPRFPGKSARPSGGRVARRK